MGLDLDYFPITDTGEVWHVPMNYDPSIAEYVGAALFERFGDEEAPDWVRVAVGRFLRWSTPVTDDAARAMFAGETLYCLPAADWPALYARAVALWQECPGGEHAAQDRMLQPVHDTLARHTFAHLAIHVTN